MVSFNDLNLEPKVNTTEIEIIGGTKIEVRDYLPIVEKADLINYIVDAAIDERTGCFSPIRLELYTTLAICKWYSNLEFEDLSPAHENYDILETNGIVGQILSAIPQEEIDLLDQLIDNTIADIARYNSSAAGIIQSMSGDAGDLSSQVDSILQKIKDKEGLELLDEIKNVTGKAPVVVKRN